jgi:hypothetical protein
MTPLNQILSLPFLLCYRVVFEGELSSLDSRMDFCVKSTMSATISATISAQDV